ncbi:MAG: indolepyruvate ferredoxin oxidoreductase subunit alpha [Actinobacteria bacterium]|nr:indolepyruvate ferredoxin oxidoreductase subunit alpha [Actinomycetota bacterium]
MKLLLSGNEAIAEGARRAGVTVACGYPGTPSTEILENIASMEGVYAQWSPNEKVALEVGIGASLGGARTLVAMKHVGLNVAADPLFTVAYTGVNAGLVIVSADDPGMHSSQNEQDNRYYAVAAKVPMVEPSDSTEAYDYIAEAFRISEEYDVPVIYRTTTRLAHSKSIVDLDGESPVEPPARAYQKDSRKYVMIPANARQRRVSLDERTKRLKKYAETTPLNGVEWGDTRIGVVTSGMAYQYAREAFPNASFLKLGLTNPLPEALISDFASKVKELFVVEELAPYLEERIKLLGIAVTGKGAEASIGELNVERIRRAFGVNSEAETVPEVEGLPVRPPMLCPGCAHRGVFYALRKAKVAVMGDIGCYTLGVLPPLEAMDTCICMGAGIGNALGFEKATGRRDVVAVIGDSTFVHSGITPLIDIVYNGGLETVVILDNRTTAMTGRQDHPGTGRTLIGSEAPELDFENLAKAVGVRLVRVVDPYELDELESVIKEAIAHEGPAVVISRRPCVLLEKKTNVAYLVDESCTDCRRCLRLGCPAISKVEGGVVIDAALCYGCGVCAGLCKFDSIKRLADD